MAQRVKEPLPAAAGDTADAPAAAGADPVAQGLAALATEAGDTLADEGQLQAAQPGADAPGYDLALAGTNAAALTMAVGIVRETLVHMARLESPKTTLADDTVAPACSAIGAVLAKRGIDLQKVTQGYELEISAAVITWPIGLAAYAGINAEIAERKRAAPAPAALPDALTSTPAAPGADAPPAEIAAPTFPPGDPRSVSLNAR